MIRQPRTRSLLGGVRLGCMLLTSVLIACGADIEPYQPTLAGIDNEGVDPDAPPKDVSFADGQFIERASRRECSAPAVFERFTVIVDNQYRQRTVLVRHVAEDCSESDGEVIGPGKEGAVTVYTNEVIRIVDVADDSVVNSWRVTRLNSLEDERIILRSTDPDI